MKDSIIDAVTDKNYGIISQFYKNYRNCKPFGKMLTATVKLDIFALLFLALIFFISTYVALKKKDVV